MLVSENAIKTIAIMLSNSTLDCYWRVLPYSLMVGSYDRTQHVIILDMDLGKFYLTINL